MWSVASLHHYDADLCEAGATAATQKLLAARGHHISMICWSLAQLQHSHPAFFAAAAEEVSHRAGELGPQHLSQLAWAFAVRKMYHQGMYDAIAARVLQLGPGRLQAHQISILAYSFGKQRHRRAWLPSAPSDELMAFLGNEAAASISAFSPQNISNTAAAFGQLGVSHAAFFGAAAAEAKARGLKGFNTQNLSDLAWGFSAAGHQDHELFDLLAPAAAAAAPDASPHSLSDLAWAYATAGRPSPELFSAVTRAAAGKLDVRFSLGMVADLLWACAAVGHRDEALLQAAAQVLPSQLSKLGLDTNAQAKVLWALKQLNFRHPQLEEALKAVIPDLDTLLAA